MGVVGEWMFQCRNVHSWREPWAVCRTPLLCPESSYLLLHFKRGRLILGPLWNIQGTLAKSRRALNDNLMRPLDVSVCLLWTRPKVLPCVLSTVRVEDGAQCLSWQTSLELDTAVLLALVEVYLSFFHCSGTLSPELGLPMILTPVAQVLWDLKESSVSPCLPKSNSSHLWPACMATSTIRSKV